MRGSVYKRGRRWYIRYDAGSDPISGARRQPSGGGYDSRQEADAALARRLADVATDHYVVPRRQTFAEYAGYWLDAVKAGRVRDNTLRHYRAVVRVHCLPAFGTVRLQAIGPQHILRLYQRLERAGHTPAHIRGIHTILRGIFGQAVRDHLLADSVLEQVRPPRAVPRPMRVLSLAELGSFFAHVLDTPHGILWYLYAATGLRRAELLGLCWCDIDWDRRVLAVRRQVVRRTPADPAAHAVRLTEELKSGNGRRLVALTRQQLDALSVYRMRANPPPAEDDLLFSGRAGQPLNPEYVTALWRADRDRLGLAHVRLHELRHTHATHYLRTNPNVKAAAARLGHDAAMLLRVYAQTDVSDQVQAVDRLESAILTPPAAPRAHARAHRGA